MAKDLFDDPVVVEHGKDLFDDPEVKAPAPGPLGIVDSIKRYFTETQAFHPKEAAQGVADMALHPVKTAQGYNDQQNELFNQARDAFKRGSITEGVRHGISYLLNAGLPGIGKRLDTAGTAVNEGDYGKGAADTAALATDLVVAPRAGKAALGAATEPGVGTAIADTATRTGKAAAAGVSEGVKAAAPDVAKGGAKIVGGMALDEMGLPHAVGTIAGVVGGGPQVIKGIGKGFKAGAAAARETFNSPREAALAQPETAVTQPAPTPLPVSRQIEAPKAIVTPPPADTSGVIKGYQPTILPNERAASPAAAVAPAKPPAVAQDLWERLSPDNQRELVQKLSNQPRPAATPAEAAALPSMPVAKPSPSVPRGTEESSQALSIATQRLQKYEKLSYGDAEAKFVAMKTANPGADPLELARSIGKPTEAPPAPTSPITGKVVWDPARGHVMEGTGKAPQVETIPFAKPTPPAETFAAPARATRAQNVATLAPKLKELGIDSSTLPAVLNDVRKAAQLRTVATSLGIDLPKDLTKTIRDLSAELAKP